LRGAKEYSKALPHYQEALKTARAGKLLEYEWLVLSDLAGMYAEMGDAKRALTHYQQALKLVQQLGDKEAEKQVRDAMQRLGKQPGAEGKPARKR